jgi:hypothetical protein
MSTGTIQTLAMVLPTEPSELSIVRGDGYMVLNWKAPLDWGADGNVSYRVYRAIGSGPVMLLANLYNTLTYNDTGLENGKEYRYEVSSVNSVGESRLRREIEGRPGTAPGIVRTFQVLAGDGYVILTWTAPLDDGGSRVLGYRVYRSEGAGPLQRIGEVDAVTFRFNDTFVRAGIEYSYVVRGYNDLGEGTPVRPITYSIEANPVEEERSFPVPLAAALFVLGLGSGLTIMFILTRRRRKPAPEPAAAAAPVPEGIQPQPEVYDLPIPEPEPSPENVEYPSPFSEPVEGAYEAANEFTEPIPLDPAYDELLRPEEGAPTFTDPPLDDPVMNQSA